MTLAFLSNPSSRFARRHFRHGMVTRGRLLTFGRVERPVQRSD